MKRFGFGWIAAVLLTLSSLPALGQEVPAKINYQGRLFDGSGAPVTGTVLMELKITDHQTDMVEVADEAHTLAGTTAIILNNANVLATSDVVTSLSGATVYVRNADYTIDYLTGEVARVGGGSIPDPSDVLIDYWYSQPVNVLWSETQAVAVDNGLYSILLGKNTPVPASIFSGGEAYLEVNVEGQRLNPRQPLATVPFAFVAASVPDGSIGADQIDFNYAGSNSRGGPATDVDCVDCVSSGEVADGAGSLLDADLLDGLDSLAFALDGHTHGIYALDGHTHDSDYADILHSHDADYADISHNHSASDITSGTMSTSRYSAYDDLDTEGYLNDNSSSDIQTRGQADDRFVNDTSDTMTGTLNVDVDVNVGDDIDVYDDADIGGDLQVDGSVGIDTAPASYIGIATKITDRYDYGAQIYGLYEGIFGSAESTSSTAAKGVIGRGTNTSTGDAYGGSFVASSAGSGTHYGIYAEADDWAAWFEGAPVHIGDSSDLDWVSGDGDLYIEDDCEVDGDLWLEGNVLCTDCIGSEDVNFNFAGSSSQGGAASDLSCSNCVSSAEVAFNYAGSSSEGGPAEDLSCTDCVSASEVNFNFAGSSSQGGPANDLSCTDCLGTPQILDIYLYNTTDTMTGSLTVNYDITVHDDLFVDDDTHLYDNLQVDGQIGIGTAPSSSYGVYIPDSVAPSFGVGVSGSTYGVIGRYSGNSYNYGALGTSGYGVYGMAGDDSLSGSYYGGRFQADSGRYAYGVYADSDGYGSYRTYGVYGDAYNYSNGIAYGGYFVASSVSGAAYGVYASGATYSLYTTGGTKSWVNPDPEDPNQSVVYATLEGGENGTYVRGVGRLENGTAVVTLPDHFRKVTSPDHMITVQVTPRSAESLGLAVTDRSNSEITVVELSGGQGSYEFDYIVHGIRLGYEDHEPVIENIDYVPFQGNLANMDEAEMTTQEWYDQRSDGVKRIFKMNGTLKSDGKVNDEMFKSRGWKNVKTRAPRPAERPE